MPPTPFQNIPDGFAEVSVFYNLRSVHNCVNSFGTSTDGIVVDQTTADGLANLILPAYNDYLSAESSTTFLEITNNISGAFQQFSSVVGAAVGSRHLDLTPLQVQGLLKKRTGSAGRQFRGRTYIGDVPRASVSDANLITSTEVGLLQDLADAIAAALGSGAGFVGDHYLLHADGSAPTLVTSFTAEGKVATLRRRFPR